MSSKKRVFWLVLILVLGFACAGCGDDSDSNEDGDADGDFDFGEPDAFGLASGYWTIKDTNAMQWLWSLGYVTGESILYLSLKGDNMIWYFDNPDGTVCISQPMTDIGGGKFSPSGDKDVCWYDYTVDALNQLVVSTRNVNDDATEAWVFEFTSVSEIPDYNAAQCESRDSCMSHEISQ